MQLNPASAQVDPRSGGSLGQSPPLGVAQPQCGVIEQGPPPTHGPQTQLFPLPRSQMRPLGEQSPMVATVVGQPF